MRKVLSFVLVLALVLSSFTMAFADDATATGLSDVNGNANEEAIVVCNDLGIVTGNPDGTYLPEKAVNRAEFAAMITRALGIPESALAGYTSTAFKDTAGYGWAVPYLAFCESKGIMLGDGAGNAMPGRTINTNEAVTMALRAVGYTANSAELVGVWPSNYVTKAQDLGLYDDVATVVSVDKANAAQIIYNTLPVRKVAVNSDGKTEYVSDVKVDGVSLQASMLTTGLNCTYEDTTIYYTDTALINITKYVGAWGTVYKNSDKEIVAFAPISTFLTGEFDGADTFTADDTDYTVKPADTTTVGATFLNAYATSNADTIADLVAMDTTLTLAVDVSGKTINKIYSAAEWKTDNKDMADASIQSEIADKKLLGKNFYENDEKVIDVDSFELAGVASLDKIAEDNVLYVYTLRNVGTNKIVKVEVGTTVVEGTVQSFKTSDGYGVAKIAGEEYTNATKSGADSEITAANLSDEVKVWLDCSGDTYDFEVTKGQANQYAVVTGNAKENGYDNIVKLMIADGTEKTYTVDSDVVTTGIVAGDLVGYSLDNDGVIDALTAHASSSAITATGSNALYLRNNSQLVVSGGAFAGSYVVKSDAVVFTYADTTEPGVGSSYDVSSVDKIEKGVPATTGADSNIIAVSNAAVFFDKDMKVTAILAPDAKAESGSDAIYGVVNEQTYVTNEDDDKVWQIVGFADGAAFDKLTNGKNKKASDDIGAKVELYKITQDNTGVITKLELQAAGNAGGTSVASNAGIIVAASGTGYVKASEAAVSLDIPKDYIVPISDKAVMYEVEYDGADIDAYSTFSGTIREGYTVWVYETDSDEDGYDVVIVMR